VAKLKILSTMIGNAMKIASRLLIAVILLISIGFNISTVALGLTWTVAASVVESITGITDVGSFASKEKAAARNVIRLAESEKKIVRLEDDLKSVSLKASKMEGKAIGSALSLERVVAEKATMEADMLALKRSKRVLFEGAEIALPEAVAKVTNRVKTRTAKIATADVGATFGQSIPWIGVAVVVAATGYDLKTSCDTMRDMHALEVAFNPDLANDPSVDEVCGLKVPTKEEVWETVKASPGKAWDVAVQALGDLPDLPAVPSIDWPSMPDVDWTPWD
jgi:hypothetical protein